MNILTMALLTEKYDNLNNKMNDIILNDINIMFKLANHYCAIKNYDKMKKYYLICIEKGCTKSMNNLGKYYQNVEKDYEKMKEYYLMAIELNNTESINNMIGYYYYIEKNYDGMIKYINLGLNLQNNHTITIMYALLSETEIYDILMKIENKNDFINTNINFIRNIIDKKIDLFIT